MEALRLKPLWLFPKVQLIQLWPALASPQAGTMVVPTSWTWGVAVSINGRFRSAVVVDKPVLP